MTIINQLKYKRYLERVRYYWGDIDNIPEKYQSEELCLCAIEQNAYAIKHIKHQSPKLCIAAINKNTDSFQYVINKTPDLCLHAVKKEGNSLRFVINKTPEICMAAVMSNGNALRYVVNQTPEVCLAAIKTNLLSIEYVRDLESIALLVDDNLVQSCIDDFIRKKEYSELKQIKKLKLMENSALKPINEVTTRNKTRSI